MKTEFANNITERWSKVIHHEKPAQFNHVSIIECGCTYRHNPIGLQQIGLLVCLDHELVNDHEIGLGYLIIRLQAEIRL